MRIPTMTTVARATVGALLAAFALTGCEAYDLPLPGSPVDKDHSIEIRAEFNDVLNLVPRSPVKVNDVTVGEVTALKRDGWHAVATLRIQDDVDLPSNAVANIQQTSLLGEKYVALEPGEGPAEGRLTNGAVLELADTGRNPELEEVLGALAFLLNGGGVGQLKTISVELNQVFNGRQGKVRHVLGELKTLVAGLDAQKGDIISAMESLNNLAGTLNREQRTVTSALDQLGPAVTILADQRAQLIRMLKALDRLGRVGTRVVNATKDDLINDLRKLAPILHEINRSGSALPVALSLLPSYPFPIESNNIVHGDYANATGDFSINLDNLVTAITGRKVSTMIKQGELPGFMRALRAASGSPADGTGSGSASDLGALLGGADR